MLGNIFDTVMDVAKVATNGTPIGAVISIVDTVVDSKEEGQHVSNEDIIKVLEAMSKSTGNKADDKLVCLVKAYLACEKE